MQNSCQVLCNKNDSLVFGKSLNSQLSSSEQYREQRTCLCIFDSYKDIRDSKKEQLSLLESMDRYQHQLSKRPFLRTCHVSRSSRTEVSEHPRRHRTEESLIFSDPSAALDLSDNNSSSKMIEDVLWYFLVITCAYRQGLEEMRCEDIPRFQMFIWIFQFFQKMGMREYPSVLLIFASKWRK